MGTYGNFLPCPVAVLLHQSVKSSVNSGLKRSRRVQKTMDDPYCILLADDHVGFCREVRKILEEIPGLKVTGEAGNRQELFEQLRQFPPKLVLLDISLPDLRGGEGTQLIKRQYPDTKVLLMVMDQGREYLMHGLAAGAAGVLPKQHVAGQIARAIAEIRRGKIYLPPQAPGKNLPWMAAPTAIRPS